MMIELIKQKSSINYNYTTIKMTRSRLEYGLLAIPTAMLNLFPSQSTEIYIYFENSNVLQEKKFIISEKNREARVYGLSEWYKKNNISAGDEILIQAINNKQRIYRFITEKKFIDRVKNEQNKFDISRNEDDARTSLLEIAKWNYLEEQETTLRELYRLSQELPTNRKERTRTNIKIKESTPPNLKIILEKVYKGHCQVCDFWFLKKDSKPFFEIHHLESQTGNNPKNLIVVCANCHRQFTYAEVKHFYQGGWLIRVVFNDREHEVNQVKLDKDLIKPYKNVFN